jgi:hypothetical protein
VTEGLGAVTGIAERGAETAARDAANFPGLRVSTRVPTNAGVPNAHLNNDALINMESAANDADTFHANADYIRQNIPQLDLRPGMSDAEVHEALIQHMTDNHLALHDELERLDPEVVRRAMKWYDGAHSIAQSIADDYNIPLQNAAAMVAAYSPATAWDSNVLMARKTADILSVMGEQKMTPEMIEWGTNDYAKRYEGTEAGDKMLQHIAEHQYTPLNQITDSNAAAHWVRMFDEVHGGAKETPMLAPEGHVIGTVMNPTGTGPQKTTLGTMNRMANAIEAFRAPDMPTISETLGNGHKVRSFYNNIVNPDAAFANPEHGDVTVDTHAAAGGLLQPLGSGSHLATTAIGSTGSYDGATGSSGLYAANQEAISRAAALRGIQPRQMQSITWTALKSMWSPEQKRSQDVIDTVDGVWRRHGAGELSQPNAQREIFDQYPINLPPWAGGAQTGE